MNRDIEHWQLFKRAWASERGMVAAQHQLAARAGAAMLDAGGHAVDAAIATAFALAAVEPWMCGLGGSGYMVVWEARTRRSTLLDFQGMLPAAIDAADYPLDQDMPAEIMGFPAVRDRRNAVGYRSILIPGAAAGLARASSRFGRLGFDRLLQPAIDLARRGLAVDWFTTLQISLSMAELARDPATRAVYLPQGRPALPETVLSLDPLADSLRMLADEGPDIFYRGHLAELMAADLKRGGSCITFDDFAAYQVLEAEPLIGRHRGFELHTAGPTSGGQRLIDMLNHVAQHLEPGAAPDPSSWRIYADALNLAWRAHRRRIGLIGETGGCTSHLSTVDQDGNMAALTFTLLNRFGSGVLLPSCGLLMNNAVSYFDPRPGHPTSLAPRKRINASNMCPVVATQDGDARFALGASGANYIMPAVAQVAALMIDFGMSLEEAINHPRLDASDRRSVRVDPRLGDAVLAALAAKHEIEVAQRLVFPKLFGCATGVSRDPESGWCHGANDPSQPAGGAAMAAPFAFEAAPAKPPGFRP